LAKRPTTYDHTQESPPKSNTLPPGLTVKL
jgi:hypothetical protein